MIVRNAEEKEGTVPSQGASHTEKLQQSFKKQSPKTDQRVIKMSSPFGSIAQQAS